MIARLTFLTDAVAAAGTALLLGAAAMSPAQQDLAAASAPFPPVNESAVHRPAQDRPFEPRAQTEPREIPIVVKRFAFEPARVEVNEGEHVRLVVTSADGVHGVGIKKFKVNQKVPRGGETVTIDFVASAPGEYPILCSEYCGNGHAAMTATLVVAATAGADQRAAAEPAPAAAAQDDDPDRDPNDAQPDFYVATLNTTLRLPAGKMNFRLTHRFTTALGQGDFGDLAGRLFGLDGGALVGLDLKYGLLPGFDIGIYRTSLDRTIQLQGRYNVIKDGNAPIGLSLVANVDGTDNFTDGYAPGVAIVLSRELGDRGAVYLQPSYVGNTNLVDDIDDDHTAMVGIGARLRFGRNSYLFAEASPRVSGFDRGVNMASFGFEQRYGGHVFQLNVSNSFGTTLAQVARGGTGSDNWYLGFNLTRKFF